MLLCENFIDLEILFKYDIDKIHLSNKILNQSLIFTKFHSFSLKLQRHESLPFILINKDCSF